MGKKTENRKQKTEVVGHIKYPAEVGHIKYPSAEPSANRPHGREIQAAASVREDGWRNAPQTGILYARPRDAEPLRLLFVFCFLFSVFCFLSSAASAQSPSLFPFVLPWDDASKTVVDVSALNPVPAGGNGAIVARGGHFYDGKGRRIRFIGVNMAADNAFPTHENADKIAARLHKSGVNIVRLHHMDASWTHPSLFDPKFPDSQHLNPEAIDRLDYFVAALKRNGVYSNINLHVSRTFTTADGVSEADKLPFAAKQANYFDLRLIELQKLHAKNLLGHVNPYTKMKFADDPAVAVVEITNENTIYNYWGGSVDTLPESYRKELNAQWNQWLKKQYKTTDALKRAWTAGDKPFGPNRLLNPDFATGAENWNLELNAAPADAKLSLPDDLKAPTGAAGRLIRITVTKQGGANWNIQFVQSKLDLTAGEPYTVSFWAKADKPRPLPVYASVDTGDYHNIGLTATAALTTEWKQYRYDFGANQVQKEHNRLVFVLGDALGTVDIAGISLRPGVETPLPEGATVEAESFPSGRISFNAQGEDWAQFLMDTESRFVVGMRDYLKNDLKVKANLCASQANFGGIGGAWRESKMDFVDAHAYWQHPNFPRKQWDMADWNIPNTAMVREPNGGELTNLALYRVAGKPFTVSEYQHPAPNDYRAETVPMLAAFAGLQDWDGFYLFDYSVNDLNSHNKITSFFDISNDPAKMAFLPAAALIFERLDMALAKDELRLRVPEGNVAGQLAKYGADRIGAWDAANVARTDALTTRFSLSFAPGKKPTSDGKPTEPFHADAAGPIKWKTQGTETPTFTADSPSSKVLLGFLGGTTAQVDGWRVQMGTTPRNFAAFTLSALDGKPMEQSKSMLLVAVGSVENFGMGWNADRTSVGDKWGTGPTQAEGIPGAVAIQTLAKSATVYALDGTGKRLEKVASKIAGGLLTFSIGPENKTIWYEIAAN